jgi:diadenosine tetraphosphate (Ap4A) HIT family hydrolase
MRPEELMCDHKTKPVDTWKSLYRQANKDLNVACTIYEDARCTVFVHSFNQCWLGRFIVYPKVYVDYSNFMANKDNIRTHMLNASEVCVKAITKLFNPDHFDIVEFSGQVIDQKVQRVQLHGIPRYKVAPDFMGKKWPDPQFKDDKFSVLNVDTQAGLVKVSPSRLEIIALVKAIQVFIPPK